MRPLTCLLIAASFFACQSAQAEIVIDNFSGPAANQTGNTTTPITRNSINFSAAPLALQAGGIAGSLTVVATNAGASFTINYGVGAGSPNPLGFGYFSVLRFTDLAVVGDWAVTFSTSNGLGPVGVSKSPAILTTGSTDFQLGLYNNTHATNLNGLTNLSLTFTNLTESGGSRVLSIGNITAVPEPATLALMSPMVLGLVYLRRRKGQAQPAEEVTAL